MHLNIHIADIALHTPQHTVHIKLHNIILHNIIIIIIHWFYLWSWRGKRIDKIDCIVLGVDGI